MAGRIEQAFRRVDDAELRFCRCLNSSSNVHLIRRLFQVVSWLGDGWFWYALIATLPFMYGSEAWRPTAHLVLTGAIGLVFYKIVKNRAVRERPYITHDVIRCVSAPLDRYSFPSGHTLHAVTLTVLMAGHFPEWAWPLSALTVLIALSRVILGLHYPSDVAAGAVFGGLLGMVSLELGARFGIV